jgi:hypothetical protein
MYFFGVSTLAISIKRAVQVVTISFFGFTAQIFNSKLAKYC